MTIAPFLLGLAIFCATLCAAARGNEEKRVLVALAAVTLSFASVVAACIPGGL